MFIERWLTLVLNACTFVIFPCTRPGYQAQQGFLVTNQQGMQYAKPLRTMTMPLCFPNILLVKLRGKLYIYVIGGDVYGSV